MPTYIVGDIHITNLVAYQAHVPRALATIARFGGRIVAGGGRVDLLEGDPMPERIFIIEFPTRRCGAAMVSVEGLSGGAEGSAVNVARTRAPYRG